MNNQMKMKPWLNCNSFALVVCVLSLSFNAWAEQVSAAPGKPVTSNAPEKAAGPKLVYGDFFADINLRLRYELVDWFEPTGGAIDSSYAFAHSKLQLGVGYKKDWFKAYAQGQYFQLYDLPTNGSGPGAAYFATNSKSHSPGDVALRQGYIALSDSSEHNSFSTMVGRYLYSSGSEGASTNKTVTWVRKQRVEQRLIGPFDFTGGRSYDGARVDWDNKRHARLTLNGIRPSQGGFETDSLAQITDVNLVTAALTSNEQFWPGLGEAQLFYYFYEDSRGDAVLKADNRDEATRKDDDSDININNFGTHWIQVYPLGSAATLDTLLWGVIQGGSWGEQDHLAGAFALETGLRFEQVMTKPWFRVGYNWSSGDSDAIDSDHTTFFQMLPTARQYAETPFYNLMNNQELFSQIIITPLPELVIRTQLAYLWLTKSEDLLYSGAGANNTHQFGYSGTSSGGDNDVGFLLGFHTNYAITDEIGVYLYYAHLFGGDVPDNAFERSDIDYGFAEMTFKF